MSTQYSSTFTTLPNTAANTQAAPAVDSAYKWIVAWLLAIILLSLLNRTRIGHVVIYYALWLMLIFLLVTQAQFIAGAFQALALPADSGPGATTSGGTTSG